MAHPVRGGSALWPFQVAFAEVLRADPSLRNMVLGGFYDGDVPPEPKAKTPYVVLSNAYESPANRLTTVARQVTFELDIYSSYAGKAEIALILNRIVLVSEESQNNFQAEGWDVNKIVYEGAQIFLEGNLRRALVRLRATLQPIPGI